MRTQTAPRGLGAPGRRLWREVTGGWSLRPDELAVLAAACRCVDTLARLDEAVESGPLLERGSKGQPRVAPAVVEARMQRVALGQLLSRLDLPDLHPQPVEDAATSAKARTAAAARWDRQLGRIRGA